MLSSPNSAAADRFLFRMCCSNVNDCLSDASTTILFVGDFNDHSVGKPFQQKTELFRLFNMFNFHQVMQSPTRCSNILDWFVTGNLHLVINSDVLPPLRNLDHSLFLELDLKFCTDFPSSMKCWDYSRTDFKKLNEILLTAPWENIIAASPTPDVALTNITDIINQSACT